MVVVTLYVKGKSGNWSAGGSCYGTMCRLRSIYGSSAVSVASDPPAP